MLHTVHCEDPEILMLYAAHREDSEILVLILFLAGRMYIIILKEVEYQY